MHGWVQISPLENTKKHFFSKRSHHCIDGNETWYFETNSTSIPSETSSPMWTEDMAATYVGRSFTLRLSRIISTSTNNVVIFSVNTSYQFNIWLHDENFFVVNQNHFGLPSKLWKIPANKLVGGTLL